MADFLSSDWVDALVAALNGSDDVRAELGDVALTIQQVVTGSPDGEVAYWISFKNGRVEGGLGRAQQPDVTISQDYATARELSTAELNPQGAFMQGKLKVTGNMGKLLQHQAAIQVLGPTMASIETDG